MRRSRTGSAPCAWSAPWPPPYGVDPARIGPIGFSAGGHLAGTLAVSPDKAFYAPTDAVDANSARPSFCGLIYAMLSMMDDAHSLRELIGTHPSASEREAYSVERHVGADTPPTFLAQAADDPVCPVENSLMMFAALRTAHIPTEMHIFQSGGHGWAVGRAGTEAHAWPELFVRWAKRNLFADGRGLMQASGTHQFLRQRAGRTRRGPTRGTPPARQRLSRGWNGRKCPNLNSASLAFITIFDSDQFILEPSARNE